MDVNQVKCAKTPENVNKTEFLLITTAFFCENCRFAVSVGITD